MHQMSEIYTPIKNLRNMIVKPQNLTRTLRGRRNNSSRKHLHAPDFQLVVFLLRVYCFKKLLSNTKIRQQEVKGAFLPFKKKIYL